ncbi:MAG: type II secretion system F family protein [Candidatus Omnitrophica bacterium]|nr:type II secretion system F family protein [Candidatus Omnitrophota bacterium]
MIAFIVYGLAFSSGALIGLAGYPPVKQRVSNYVSKQVQSAQQQLEDLFFIASRQQLQLLHLAVPPTLGLLLWLASGIWFLGLLGFVGGIVVPRLWVKRFKASRYKKFQNQLVDGLMLLSSCLRAGLSMMQSFAVVAEEMPAPISQEFGLILKETRMGIGLEDAMTHFKKRLPSNETNLFVTAVLVTRELGGDITTIFTQLVETLRERKKIRERIVTLTFMARLQGIIMMFLPVAFIFVTYNIDKSHFNFFLQDPLGRVILGGIILAQMVTIALFLRFGRMPF